MSISYFRRMAAQRFRCARTSAQSPIDYGDTRSCAQGARESGWLTCARAAARKQEAEQQQENWDRRE